MMVKPTKAELLEKTDSKFRLAIATAKRARQIAEGHEKLVDTKEESTSNNSSKWNSRGEGNNMLVILSGVAGAGKDTIKKELIKGWKM